MYLDKQAKRQQIVTPHQPREACGRVWRNLLFKNLKLILSISSIFHHFFIYGRLFPPLPTTRWWSWVDYSNFPMMTLITATSYNRFLTRENSQPWLPRALCSAQAAAHSQQWMAQSAAEHISVITASYSCSPRVHCSLHVQMTSNCILISQELHIWHFFVSSTSKWCLLAMF